MPRKVFAVVLILALAGAGFWAAELKAEKRAAETSSTLRVADYYPAEPGMRWEYRGEGMEYASFVREVLYREGNLVQIMVDNGGTRMAHIYEIGPDRVTRRYAEAEVYDNRNLLTTQLSSGSSLYTPVDILRMPGGARVWTSADGSVTSELVSADAVVETAAGVFSDVIVIRTRHKGSTGEVYEYYAPDIGLVKQEFQSEEYVVISELVKFTKANGEVVLEAPTTTQ